MPKIVTVKARNKDGSTRDAKGYIYNLKIGAGKVKVLIENEDTVLHHSSGYVLGTVRRIKAKRNVSTREAAIELLKTLKERDKGVFDTLGASEKLN